MSSKSALDWLESQKPVVLLFISFLLKRKYDMISPPKIQVFINAVMCSNLWNKNGISDLKFGPNHPSIQILFCSMTREREYSNLNDEFASKRKREKKIEIYITAIVELFIEPKLRRRYNCIICNLLGKISY